MVLLSFGFFLLLFVVVGVLSVLKRQQTTQDYLLASHNVPPWLVALSAIATNNSGYMFVGQIGFTYQYGLHSIWLMIGWIFGDFLMSLLVHKKLRVQTEEQNTISFVGVLSKWYGTNYKKLRLIGGVTTLIFLGTYAAAQLNAGSKALHVLFGWDYSMGAIIGAVIVLLYCLAGGIRASIWTDAAQSFVMVCAMMLMLFVALMEIGGVSSFIDGLYNVSPEYMDWFPTGHRWGDAYIGPFLFVLGWFFAGVGVIGQPHIMVRFMSMDNPAHMVRARAYYYGWYVLFYALTITVALAARLLIPETSAFDAELALPTLAGQLLPEVLVGLVLAGLFAATMSTADSQILSCTAAITRDITPNRFTSYLANKLTTVFVTAVALTIALSGNESVFSLVLIAWSALASAFAPLLIVLAFKQKVTEGLAIAMVLGGIGTMLAWRYFDLNDITYEIAPGILAGILIFGIGKVLGLAQKSVENEGSVSG